MLCYHLAEDFRVTWARPLEVRVWVAFLYWPASTARRARRALAVRRDSGVSFLGASDQCELFDQSCIVSSRKLTLSGYQITSRQCIRCQQCCSFLLQTDQRTTLFQERWTSYSDWLLRFRLGRRLQRLQVYHGLLVPDRRNSSNMEK